MYPLKEETESKASPDREARPSPVTYNLEESFKSTQLIKPRFFIRKGTVPSYAVEVSKKKSFVPAPGQYDIDKASLFMTKGASKGWKWLLSSSLVISIFYNLLYIIKQKYSLLYILTMDSFQPYLPFADRVD